MTQEELKEALIYFPETGLFFWRKSGRNKSIYSAGTCDVKGYIRIQVNGTTYAAHRLAWLYMTGNWPNDQIDHKNRLKSDNRFENLRDCSNAENNANTGPMFTSRTGIRGVHPNSARTAWRVKYKGKYIGQYKTIEQAQIELEKVKTNG